MNSAPVKSHLNMSGTVAPGPKPPQKRRSSRGARLFMRLLLMVIVLGATGIVGIAAFHFTRQIVVAWSGTGGVIGPQIVESSPTPALNALGTPLPTLEGGQGGTPSIPAVTLTPWDGAGRVTVLLLGLDYRDWEASQEASRSDTMILLTLDPQTKTAGVLSIPRDLWVAIPDFKHGKINTAYYLGDAYKLPGGGPALAVKTVEQLLGVPINYYAQIDFKAFERFIDEIGGVKIDVPYPITIDLLGSGPTTKKRLKAGAQVLPGAYALAYARNRHTENGDFDRAVRQQQVIMAIRDQILRFDMLPTLISKAPQLYSELASGIRTNLTLDQVIRLALLAQTVPEESIQRDLINKDNVYFATSPDGLSILIPIPDDINNLRDRMFAGPGSLSPQASGSLQEQTQAEGAKIVLYNGSSDASLGTRAANYLRGLGLTVAQVAQADKSTPTTTITDHTGNPYALRYLVDLLHITPLRIAIQFDLNNTYDLEVTLGNDLVNSGLIP
jgi:LCP family protein required for cell wall assembly